MMPGEALQYALAAFLWTVSGFLAFFVLVFVVVFISDGIKAWLYRRRVNKIIKASNQLVEEIDTYFDKVTEYRNELS